VSVPRWSRLWTIEFALLRGDVANLRPLGTILRSSLTFMWRRKAIALPPPSCVAHLEGLNLSLNTHMGEL
jgi:hypothetical protein